MLGNGSHFRALIRSKHAWIIYGGMGVTDGLMPSARFEFVPLDDLARAQGDYHCNTALYEVLDAEETRTFGNPDFDITKTLVHSPGSFIPTCFAESDGEEEEESDGEEEEDEDCEFNGTVAPKSCQSAPGTKICTVESEARLGAQARLLETPQAFALLWLAADDQPTSLAGRQRTCSLIDSPGYLRWCRYSKK